MRAFDLLVGPARLLPVRVPDRSAGRACCGARLMVTTSLQPVHARLLRRTYRFLRMGGRKQ
jgi:hypothetical protein